MRRQKGEKIVFLAVFNEGKIDMFMWAHFSA
jgi:hypothetical protein